MDLIHALTSCLTGRTVETKTGDAPRPSEKAHLMMGPAEPSYYDEKPGPSDDDIASSIVSILLSAEKPGAELQARLNDTVHPYGWTENIAKAILRGLVDVIMKGAAMNQAMNDACNKAVNEAVEFAKEHPVYCTIIALGVLVVLAPWVIEALGFGELGPIEGMC